VTSSLTLGANAAAGIWQVTARLDDESVGRWTFRLVPASEER
jgi:hypothetical protein